MKMRWSCMLLTILLCTGIAAEVRSADIKVDARTIAVMYFQNNAMLNKEAMAPSKRG